jgi:hypothetical protein
MPGFHGCALGPCPRTTSIHGGRAVRRFERARRCEGALARGETHDRVAGLLGSRELAMDFSAARGRKDRAELDFIGAWMEAVPDPVVRPMGSLHRQSLGSR